MWAEETGVPRGGKDFLKLGARFQKEECEPSMPFRHFRAMLTAVPGLELRAFSHLLFQFLFTMVVPAG